jgi:predicted acetyltransferase
MPLLLRPFTPKDEVVSLAAQKDFECARLSFLTSYYEAQPWDEWLALMAMYREGRNIPKGHVPGAMLAAEVDGELVGRVSVRFSLNEYLANRGGHIGYAVIREHRRKGYATEMLRQALRFADNAGVRPILVTCDEDNIASAAVIERCGGVLESVGPDADGIIYRRYWF